MTKDEKVKIKLEKSITRHLKNRLRNENRWLRSGRNSGKDCPFDVEMNNMYGTCHCNGENYNGCLGDI